MEKFLESYGHSVIAELYDLNVTETDDVEMIRSLVKGRERLNVLECFCGTGRILIPLALDGHRITGIDLSKSMIDRAKAKIGNLEDKVRGSITLINDDIAKQEWGRGYDMIIIGANALYELPSPDIQEKCIQKAYDALSEDGILFLDSNDYKGNWGESHFYNERVTFEGRCTDGCWGRYVMKHKEFHDDSNTLLYKRRLHITDPQGKETILEYEGQKHPVTKTEIQSWLVKHNFNIIRCFGDTKGTDYTSSSHRVIFLANKK